MTLLVVYGADEQPGATVIVDMIRVNSSEYAKLVAQVLAAHKRVKTIRSFCPTPAVGFACAASDDAVGGVIVTATELSCDITALSCATIMAALLTATYWKLLTANPLVPTKDRGSYQSIDLMTPILMRFCGY